MSDRERNHKIRRSMSRGTPSYQLGHYEMIGDPGKRRSAFRVDVHLGEHASAEQALSTWPEEVQRLRKVGREAGADRLEAKLIKLRQLTKGENDAS
jgi:hypothetical protein